MIKNRTIVEVEVKGRAFGLECYSESPLEDVTQAIMQIQAIVNEKIKAIEAANKAAQEEQQGSNE